MEILNDQDRFDCWAQYMRENRDPISLNKNDLRSAVDATDLWIQNNAASYNSALPIGARSALTAKQKARLLVHVIQRRFERS